jgi:plasmid stabilization system protein ParE
MRELAFTSRSSKDFRQARRWYEEQREGLGAKFMDAAHATLMHIQRAPLSFQEVFAPFRRAVIRRFPYELFYTFDDHRVLVVMLFHTARDPAIALARLRNH